MLEQAFQVGVKGVILNNENKILLLKEKNYSGTGYSWDIPGGRIQDNDSIQETLERELKEEIKNLNTWKLEGIIHAHRVQKNFPNGLGLFLVFYKIITNLDEKVEISSEHEDFKWIQRNDIDKLGKDTTVLLKPHMRDAIECAF